MEQLTRILLIVSFVLLLIVLFLIERRMDKKRIEGLNKGFKEKLKSPEIQERKRELTKKSKKELVDMLIKAQLALRYVTKK